MYIKLVISLGRTAFENVDTIPPSIIEISEGYVILFYHDICLPQHGPTTLLHIFSYFDCKIFISRTKIVLASPSTSQAGSCRSPEICLPRFAVYRYVPATLSSHQSTSK